MANQLMGMLCENDESNFTVHLPHRKTHDLVRQFILKEEQHVI